MTTLHTEALVLRAVDWSESDRIVHLLTPATGRVTAIAKGARRSRKRFPGTLDFFNHLQVQLERRQASAMARLEHARLLSTLAPLRESASRFALGCYLLELMDRLAPEGMAGRDARPLFAFALDALRVAAEQPPLPRLRTLLELRALDALGLRPELSRCVRCGREATARDGVVGFHVAEGGPVCASCAGRRPAQLSIHLGTLRALEGSLRFAPTQLGRIALGGVALQEARSLVSRFLRFHVGIELRSAHFLDAQLTLPDPSGKLLPPDPGCPGSA